MKPNLLIFLAVSALAGCETLASRDMAAGCQVADVASTEYALHRGGVEQNQAFPINVLLALKLALASYIKWGDNHWEEAPVGLRVFVSAVGCGAAANNVYVGHHR